MADISAATPIDLDAIEEQLTRLPALDAEYPSFYEFINELRTTRANAAAGLPM